MSPARSRKQQEMAAADLERLRQGKPTRTGMTEQQLKEFASTPTKNLPTRVKRRGS